jgi:hypothetical protein
MGLSALQSFSQDNAIARDSERFFALNAREITSLEFSPLQHVSALKDTSGFFPVRWSWPDTNLTAAVFRVSFYPPDGFFLSKPTQVIFHTYERS